MLEYYHVNKEFLNANELKKCNIILEKYLKKNNSKVIEQTKISSVQDDYDSLSDIIEIKS
jgi:hypothetical protein